MELKRVNKRTARKIYRNGGTLFVLPCKMRFDNWWHQPLEMSRKKLCDDDFDTVVNCYEYYNCNAETGKYCAYYLK